MVQYIKYPEFYDNGNRNRNNNNRNLLYHRSLVVVAVPLSFVCNMMVCSCGVDGDGIGRGKDRGAINVRNSHSSEYHSAVEVYGDQEHPKGV